MIIAELSLLNTILSYFYIDVTILSYLGGVSFLTLGFLYISSYVFKFCAYHRMFLHYTVVNNLINIYDYYFVIPLDTITMIVVQLIIAGIFIFIILYLHQHDKLPRREDCGKAVN